MSNQRFRRWTRRERHFVRSPKLEVCDDDDDCRDDKGVQDIKPERTHLSIRPLSLAVFEHIVWEHHALVGSNAESSPECRYCLFSGIRANCVLLLSRGRTFIQEHRALVIVSIPIQSCPTSVSKFSGNTDLANTGSMLWTYGVFSD